MKPMMDGPQASSTPAPLSTSCRLVRTNSNGKTTKLQEEGQWLRRTLSAVWLG